MYYFSCYSRGRICGAVLSRPLCMFRLVVGLLCPSPTGEGGDRATGAHPFTKVPLARTDRSRERGPASAKKVFSCAAASAPLLPRTHISSRAIPVDCLPRTLSCPRPRPPILVAPSPAPPSHPPHPCPLVVPTHLCMQPLIPALQRSRVPISVSRNAPAPTAMSRRPYPRTHVSKPIGT